VSAHIKNKTFGPRIDPKDLPAGRKPIPLDVILKLKRDGTEKARAIIKGFHMTAGLDFNETFAPVPCATVLRFFFSLAAKYDWEIKQGDVRTAFLMSEMDTEVYVAVPNWFRPDIEEQPEPMHGYGIHQMLKGVPGIPQGPRLFNRKSRCIYINNGLKQCKSEFCLYYCLERHLYLIVWVDDLFLFNPTAATKQATELWKKLQEELDLDDPQDVDDCLSCYVRRDRPNRTISLTQEPAIRKLRITTKVGQ